MISICPICHSTYEQNPQRCSCGYEGLEVFIHEKQDEYWKNQLFHIYKYTKNVYYKRIEKDKDKCFIKENDNSILIRDAEANQGLSILEIDTDKETIVDMGAYALNRKVQSVILNVDTIDTDFLDESSIHILFFGEKVKRFTEGYLNQKSSLKYLFVDPENKYFSSENHVLFNKNMSELLCYPSGKNEEEYVVPKAVKRIHPYAFRHPQYLKRLYVSNKNIFDEKTIQNLTKQNIEVIIGEE